MESSRAEPSQASSLLTDGPWGRAGLAASEESIKLIPKIRPSSTPGLPDYVQYVGHKALALSAPGAENALWDFDFVASPHTRQSSFFRVAGRPMADHFLTFYNAAIIAYGQTGSGKTHTMLGTIPSGRRGASAGVLDDMPREAGLIPRVLDYIFQRIAAESQDPTASTPPGTAAPKQSAAAAAVHTAVPRPLPQPPLSPSGCLTPIAENVRPRSGRSGIPTPPPTTGLVRNACYTPPPASPREMHGPGSVHGPGSASGPQSRSRAAGAGPTQYLVKASMLQIYQEVVTDLLNPRPVRLQLRESMQGGVTVVGLSEVTIRSAAEALQLLRVGTSHRAVAETASNPVSSRSHCILTLHMEAKDTMDTGVVRIRRSRLQLVDLAGSERTTKHADHGSTRQKEANAINKSLSTLCLVIARLSDRTRSQGPVPYRDSKLTFLLQDCLGGNAKTLFIANLNPSPTCASETNMTLGFALRAKRVRNRAVVNEDHQGDAVVLQGEVRRLREELSIFRTLHAKDAPPKGLEQLSAWRDQAAARASELHNALELNTELETKLTALETAHNRLKTEHNALEEQCEAQRCEMSALEATVEQCEDELLLLRARPTVEQYKALEEKLRVTTQERDQARAQQSELAVQHSKLRIEYEELAALVEASLQDRGVALQRAQQAMTALASAPQPSPSASTTTLALREDTTLTSAADTSADFTAALVASVATEENKAAAAYTYRVTSEVLLPGEDLLQLRHQEEESPSLFAESNDDDDEVGLPAELELGMGHVAEQLQLQQRHHSALEEAYAALVAEHAALAAEHTALLANHERQLAELKAANAALTTARSMSTAPSSSPSRGSQSSLASPGGTAGSVAAAASNLRGRCRSAGNGEGQGEVQGGSSPRQHGQSTDGGGGARGCLRDLSGAPFCTSHPGSCSVSSGALEAVLESPEENDGLTSPAAYAPGALAGSRPNSSSLHAQSTYAVGSPSAQVCFASPPDSLSESPGYTSALEATARSTARTASNASSSSNRVPLPVACGVPVAQQRSTTLVSSLRGSWGVRRWCSQGSAAAITARSAEMWRPLNSNRQPRTPRDHHQESEEGSMGSARSYNSAPPTISKTSQASCVRHMVRQLDELLSCPGARAAVLQPENDESRSRGTLVRVNPLFECRRGDESRTSLESREAALEVADVVGALLETNAPVAAAASSMCTTTSSVSSGALPAKSDSIACELPLPPDDQLAQSPVWPLMTTGLRDAAASGAAMPSATKLVQRPCSSGQRGVAFLPLQEIQLGSVPPAVTDSPDAKPTGHKPDLIAAPGLQTEGTPCSRPLAPSNSVSLSDGCNAALTSTVASRKMSGGSPSTPTRCLPRLRWAGPGEQPDAFTGRRGVVYGDPRLVTLRASAQLHSSSRGSGSWMPVTASSPSTATTAANDENVLSPAAAAMLQGAVGGTYQEHPAASAQDSPLRAHQNPLSASVIGVSAPLLQATLPPRPTSASATAGVMAPAFFSVHRSGRRGTPTASLSAGSAAAAATVVAGTTEDATRNDGLGAIADGLLPAESGGAGDSAVGSPATRRLREELSRQQVLVENVAQLEDELARRLAGEAQLRRELQSAMAEAQHAGEQMAVLVQLNSALVDDLTQRDERLRGFEELLARLYSDLKFIVREVLQEPDTPFPQFRAMTASSPPATWTTAREPEDGSSDVAGQSKETAAGAVKASNSPVPLSARTPVAHLRFSPTRSEEGERDDAAGAAHHAGSASTDSNGAEKTTPQYMLPRLGATGSGGAVRGAAEGPVCSPATSPSPSSRPGSGSSSAASPVERPGSVMALGVMRMITRLRDGLSDRAQHVTRLEAQLLDTRSRLESIEEDLTKNQDDPTRQQQPEGQGQAQRKVDADQAANGLRGSAAWRAWAAAAAAPTAGASWAAGSGKRSGGGVEQAVTATSTADVHYSEGCDTEGGRNVAAVDCSGTALPANSYPPAAVSNPLYVREASCDTFASQDLSTSLLRESNLQAQLRNRELQVVELMERTEQLEAALQEAISERDARVSELQTQANRLASSLQAQLRSRDTQISEVQGHAADLDAALRGASAEAARCRQQAAEAVTRCERYATELRAIEYREEMLMNKLRQMEMMFLHRGEEVNALREELALAADQLAGMRAQAVAAQVEAAAARQSAAALQDALDDLRRSVSFQKASGSVLPSSSRDHLHGLRHSFNYHHQGQGHSQGHLHGHGHEQGHQNEQPPPPPFSMPPFPMRAVASSGGAPPQDAWQYPMPYFSRSDGGAVEGYATAAYQPSGSWAPMDSSRDYAGHYDNHSHSQGNLSGGRTLGRNSGGRSQMLPAAPASTRGALGPAHGKGPASSRGVPPGQAGSQDHNGNKGTWVQRFLCRKGVTVDGSPGAQHVTAILTPAKWRPKGMTGIVLRQWVPSTTNNQRRVG